MTMTVIYNYHTHTARCGHASGTEEEYILRAIEGGIAHMGFSDHAPYVYPDGFQSSYRIPMEQAEDYFSTLYALREKYKDQIDLKIGFEMEYYPAHFSAMLDTARSLGCEYLILGQHYLDTDHPESVYVVKPSDDPARLNTYVSNVLDAMETGVFTYVAHPDIFNFTGDAAVYDAAMRKICVAAREHNVPLEINFLGIRSHRKYPREDFWAIAGQEQAPVTFGFDAHDAPSAYDSASLDTAMALVSKYHLNYIGQPKLILLQDN